MIQFNIPFNSTVFYTYFFVKCRKILKSLAPHPKTEIMYVRYLLAFRLWRKINNDLAVRKKIQETAVSILGSPPSVLPEFLSKYIISSTLGSQTLSSQFLMTHKFDMKACSAEFLTLCRENIESSPENQGEINCPERAQDTDRSPLVCEFLSCFSMFNYFMRHDYFYFHKIA